MRKGGFTKKTEEKVKFKGSGREQKVRTTCDSTELIEGKLLTEKSLSKEREVKRELEGIARPGKRDRGLRQNAKPSGRADQEKRKDTRTDKSIRKGNDREREKERGERGGGSKSSCAKGGSEAVCEGKEGVGRGEG